RLFVSQPVEPLMLLAQSIQLLDQRLTARIVGSPVQLLAIGQVVEQRLRFSALQRLEGPRGGAQPQLERQQRLKRLALVFQKAGPQRNCQAALDSLDRGCGGAIASLRAPDITPRFSGAAEQ